jgi:ribosome-associated protein
VFDVHASNALTEEQKRRIAARCGPRVTAVAQDARSQARNRELALQRLEERLTTALHVPRSRRPTKPTKASRERRLESKKRASQRKQARRRPSGSEE